MSVQRDIASFQKCAAFDSLKYKLGPRCTCSILGPNNMITLATHKLLTELLNSIGLNFQKEDVF